MGIIKEDYCSRLFVLKLLGIALVSLMLMGCKNSKPGTRESQKIFLKAESHCMEKVLEEDIYLGELRNQASRSISLSEAILKYTEGMRALDFSNCPEDFTVAFKEHIDAWEELRDVSDYYPAVRGELHDVFQVLEKSKDSVLFNQLVERVWKTWELVEQRAK